MPIYKFEPVGERLFQTLVSLSGLPEEMVRQELDKILARSGESRETVTLDKLRMAMMEYLDSVHLDMSTPGGPQSESILPH